MKTRSKFFHIIWNFNAVGFSILIVMGITIGSMIMFHLKFSNNHVYYSEHGQGNEYDTHHSQASIENVVDTHTILPPVVAPPVGEIILPPLSKETIEQDPLERWRELQDKRNKDNHKILAFYQGLETLIMIMRRMDGNEEKSIIFLNQISGENINLKNLLPVGSSFNSVGRGFIPVCTKGEKDIISFKSSTHVSWCHEEGNELRAVLYVVKRENEKAQSVYLSDAKGQNFGELSNQGAPIKSIQISYTNLINDQQTLLELIYQKESKDYYYAQVSLETREVILHQKVDIY